ncbi:MAG: Uma2 family endonuclease [Cyanobacteria bacterium J06633_23]
MNIWVIPPTRAVRSNTTADFDRGDKFKDYALLTSLEEYVLIDQDILKVECFRRIGDQQWDTVIYSVGEPITFKSIGLECPLKTCIEALVLPEDLPLLMKS